MTLVEAPLWVWIPLLLSSISFLLMCLTPLLWEWHKEVQIKRTLQPIPIVIGAQRNACTTESSFH